MYVLGVALTSVLNMPSPNPTLLERLGSFFSYSLSFGGKSKKPKKPLVHPIETMGNGDFVEVIFRDPRKLGVLDPSGQLTKRYDPEDMETRCLVGTVTNVFARSGLRFVELTVTKIVRDVRKTRTYTLMEDDLEKVRVLRAA